MKKSKQILAKFLKASYELGKNFDYMLPEDEAKVMESAKPNGISRKPDRLPNVHPISPKDKKMRSQPTTMFPNGAPSRDYGVLSNPEEALENQVLHVDKPYWDGHGETFITTPRVIKYPFTQNPHPHSNHYMESNGPAGLISKNKLIIDFLKIAEDDSDINGSTGAVLDVALHGGPIDMDRAKGLPKKANMEWDDAEKPEGAYDVPSLSHPLHPEFTPAHRPTDIKKITPNQMIDSSDFPAGYQDREYPASQTGKSSPGDGTILDPELPTSKQTMIHDPFLINNKEKSVVNRVQPNDFTQWTKQVTPDVNTKGLPFSLNNRLINDFLKIAEDESSNIPPISPTRPYPKHSVIQPQETESYQKLQQFNQEPKKITNYDKPFEVGKKKVNTPFIDRAVPKHLPVEITQNENGLVNNTPNNPTTQQMVHMPRNPDYDKLSGWENTLGGDADYTKPISRFDIGGNTDIQDKPISQRDNINYDLISLNHKNYLIEEFIKEAVSKKQLFDDAKRRQMEQGKDVAPITPKPGQPLFSAPKLETPSVPKPEVKPETNHDYSNMFSHDWFNNWQNKNYSDVKTPAGNNESFQPKVQNPVEKKKSRTLKDLIKEYDDKLKSKLPQKSNPQPFKDVDDVDAMESKQNIAPNKNQSGDVDYYDYGNYDFSKPTNKLSPYGWIGRGGEFYHVPHYAGHSQVENAFRNKNMYNQSGIKSPGYYDYDWMDNNHIHVSPEDMRIPKDVTEQQLGKLMEYNDHVQNGGFDKTKYLGGYGPTQGIPDYYKNNIKKSVEKAMERMKQNQTASSFIQQFLKTAKAKTLQCRGKDCFNAASSGGVFCSTCRNNSDRETKAPTDKIQYAPENHTKLVTDRKANKFTEKEHRQEKHIQESEEAAGKSAEEAEEIGYATVNKQKHSKANAVLSAFLKEANENPCWEGYEMVGKKTKNGKEVPNCVPKKKAEALLKEALNPGAIPFGGGSDGVVGKKPQLPSGRRDVPEAPIKPPNPEFNNALKERYKPQEQVSKPPSAISQSPVGQFGKTIKDYFSTAPGKHETPNVPGKHEAPQNHIERFVNYLKGLVPGMGPGKHDEMPIGKHDVNSPAPAPRPAPAAPVNKPKMRPEEEFPLIHQFMNKGKESTAPAESATEVAPAPAVMPELSNTAPAAEAPAASEPESQIHAPIKNTKIKKAPPIAAPSEPVMNEPAEMPAEPVADVPMANEQPQTAPEASAVPETPAAPVKRGPGRPRKNQNTAPAPAKKQSPLDEFMNHEPVNNIPKEEQLIPQQEPVAETPAPAAPQTNTVQKPAPKQKSTVAPKSNTQAPAQSTPAQAPGQKAAPKYNSGNSAKDNRVNNIIQSMNDPNVDIKGQIGNLIDGTPELNHDQRKQLLPPQAQAIYDDVLKQQQSQDSEGNVKPNRLEELRKKYENRQDPNPQEPVAQESAPQQSFAKPSAPQQSTLPDAPLASGNSATTRRKTQESEAAKKEEEKKKPTRTKNSPKKDTQMSKEEKWRAEDAEAKRKFEERKKKEPVTADLNELKDLIKIAMSETDNINDIYSVLNKMGYSDNNILNALR